MCYLLRTMKWHNTFLFTLELPDGALENILYVRRVELSWYKREISSIHGGIYKWMEDEIWIFDIF
jgi:hypothetical protein